MTLKAITASISLFGLAASTALAAEPAPPVDTSGTTASPLQESRRVVRDKETGKLRSPTEEELAAERAERKARGEPEPGANRVPLAVRQHPNGMRSAVLGPEYLVTLRAERGPDGKLVIKHANPAHEHPVAPQQQATE
ncbi:hypothetical protein BurJ1DRAFT_1241 [Burkholderiales bacterium JOSHI_001]|nr:hypothetical protein BurJ1DRAFT_1241 [Burkholderiales bacterium JOSHI_001]